MINLPAPHAIAAIVLTIAMFYGFVSGRLKVEVISLLTICAIALGLYFFPLPGQLAKDGLHLAFGGFAHPALITICALMVMGRGLVVTGALDPIARILIRIWRFNQLAGLAVTLLMAMGMSMLMNDTPVIVLLLPIMMNIATSGGMPASKTLIPINAAVLIGGMGTTIGTSTNLLVVAIATDLGLAPMGVFHFTPVVLMAAVVALPYILWIMPRLLPDNSVAVNHEPRRFYVSLRLDSSSPSFGKSLAEIAALLPSEVTLLRASDSRAGNARRLSLLVPRALLPEVQNLLQARAAPGWLYERLNTQYSKSGEDLAVAEMILTADSELIGKSVKTSGVGDFNVAILGVCEAKDRTGLSAQTQGYQTPFSAGDVLLVSGTLTHIKSLARGMNLLTLEGAVEVPRVTKAPLALAIMVAAIAPASFGWAPIAICSLAGAIAMFLTGCVKFDRVGRALSAKVIVLVAASIVLGKIILDSGAASWLSQLLSIGLHYLPPAGVLAAVMLFVTILTNFASNTTAAAVGTPIAFSLGQQLGIPVEPLVLAVLFGCNLCYATPIAYQTNMLIMSAGEYQFKDYTKTGIPLVLIMVTMLTLLLVWKYQL